MHLYCNDAKKSWCVTNSWSGRATYSVMPMPEICCVHLAGLSLLLQFLCISYCFLYKLWHSASPPLCVQFWLGKYQIKECSGCYIWGFTFIPKCNGTQKAQCFLCGRFIAKGNMNPTNLKEHLIKILVLKHPTRLLILLPSKQSHTRIQRLWWIHVSWKWFGWFVALKWCHPLWNLLIVCSRSLRNWQLHHSTSTCNWTSCCSQVQVLTCYVNDGTIRENYFMRSFLNITKTWHLGNGEKVLCKARVLLEEKNLRTFA